MQIPPLDFLNTLRKDLASQSEDALRGCFSVPRGADYLFAMARNRGGLKKLRVAIIPSPPGWKGSYWAIFHTCQTIEEDHDPIYPVTDLVDGTWKLGPEIPEDRTGGWSIAGVNYRAKIDPPKSMVSVSVDLKLRPGTKCAVPFRLNDIYRPDHTLQADDHSILSPKKGDWVRAGSLLVQWTANPKTEAHFTYSAQLPQSDDDEVTADDAYVTAWWLPSLGRLPFSVRANITGPLGWKIRGEGFETSHEIVGNSQTCSFVSDLPISYPKIIAGTYVQMASERVKGDTFKIWQLKPVDPERAKRDLKNMVDAAAFYRQVLGRLPFHGYECYDAMRYYGIESYSHTLLRRDATHFISHEMGHSYFGGLAPCAYVNDSWNEGVTQYVDSVLLQKDSDHSLEMGLGTTEIHLALTHMPIPWNLGDATYWRGCYVMKMLEAEIGPQAVLSALAAIASERKGRDTRWRDLRAYFERSGHKDLGWFWGQWIESATFPKVSYKTASHLSSPSTWDTKFEMTQSGTPSPYRIRLVMRVKSGVLKTEQVVQLKDASSSFTVTSPFKPESVEVDLFPYSLGSVQKLKQEGL